MILVVVLVVVALLALAAYTFAGLMVTHYAQQSSVADSCRPAGWWSRVRKPYGCT